MLAHVERVLAGEPIYVEPALEFAPFPYPPGFFWIAALVARITGPGFLALRLVSIAASVATLALLFVLVRRGAGSTLAGLVSAGLYAACYRFAGAWTDIGRVDALELVLLLAAFACVEVRRDVRQAAIAGTLLGCACLVKQSASLTAFFLLAGLARRGRRETLACSVALALVAGGIALALDRASGGWFRWTLVRMPAGHEWSRALALGFWRDLALALWPSFLVIASSRLARPAGSPAPAGSLAPWFAAGLVAEGWLARSHTGGYDNAFLAPVLACALLLGPTVARARARGGPLALAASVLVLAQFLLHARDPRELLPSRVDRAAGERIVAMLRDAPGEVFVPYHGSLARAAGKGPSVHAMALNDLLRSGEHEVAARFVGRLEAALAARRWSLVVLDDPIWELTLPALLPNYRRGTMLFPSDDTETFVPVTGARWRPLFVYEPQ